MEEPLIIPTNQGTTAQTQLPNTFNNQVLKTLSETPYLKINPKQLNCIEAFCSKERILYVYALSSPDNEVNEDAFLFKLVYTIPCPIPCIPGDFEVKCYTGSNKENANEYFCSYFIKAPPLCNFDPCIKRISCSNMIFEDLKFKIAPKNLEINQDDQVNDYGRIERYMTCMGFNVRKFYDYNQSDFKYQIGKEDCTLMCTIPFCNITCKCPPPLCANFGQLCKPIRTKFKTILDNNLSECGEFTIIQTPKFLCFCHELSFEIRFPNDANVSMRLLLLGGLMEAILCFYQSNP